jgi:methionyl-tRNA formyltransferase
MRIVQALDAGGMFTSRALPIGPDQTAGDVEEALAELGGPLLVEVVEQLAAGTAREAPQDEGLVTYAPRLTKDDGRIDWSRTAGQLQCFVRGMQPWPGAVTWAGRQRWIVGRVREVVGEVATEAPGTVRQAAGDRLVVACGQGTSLSIAELQPEGKRMMSAREFLAGHRVAPGTPLRDAPA